MPRDLKNLKQVEPNVSTKTQNRENPLLSSAHPTLFLRKEVFQRHGVYDISFKVSADYDFMLKIMKDKDMNLKYLPEIITKMRVGGTSTGSLKQIIRKSTEDVQVLRNHGFRLPFMVLVAKNIRKIPILGHLFRSQEYVKGETEEAALYRMHGFWPQFSIWAGLWPNHLNTPSLFHLGY